jgi:hypothetical protein
MRGQKPLVSLSDEQLQVVLTAAAALDVEKRDAFLRRVAALLGRQAGHIGDGDVSGAVEKALHSLLMSAA